ncbi:hypothetical protein SGQ83_00025 [Flavobacterium sp. Fl-318]|uniref:Lipocalin-like domain-containing protein n=1 Tax=Flavobacterium cupriresistens TaxID=2893885 RepID=A0ABU4R7F4_9FLAO|nr:MULTISPECIES: hypothetical protein [unclassified Flavobacterium]MDX6187723.1 hypothetical protein [Flavobacterium sp. Fl-318]UFH42354.1 hypothetical protein LNP23_21425 [Flavobacterium sp. F-323]
MNILFKLFICFFSISLYSQEMYLGQYKSKNNLFVSANQTNKSMTFLQLILYQDGNYLLHTESRLGGKRVEDYYVLDCSEHIGKWLVNGRELILISYFEDEKQEMRFIKVRGDNELVFLEKNRKNRKIRLNKTSLDKKISCADNVVTE